MTQRGLLSLGIFCEPLLRCQKWCVAPYVILLRLAILALAARGCSPASNSQLDRLEKLATEQTKLIATMMGKLDKLEAGMTPKRGWI